jgi:glycosyltransferase involved in cell wall biosynthesis
MPARVSLAMPVWNGEKYLCEGIDSILAQKCQDFDLIITDNASTDRTAEICMNYQKADRRIRYVRNETNIGAGANFNLGFALCTGELFKWCAHDDRISENYLADCVRELDLRTSAVAAVGRLEGIDPAGEITAYVERQRPEMIRAAFDEGASPAQRFAAMMRSNGLDSAIFGVYRRSALERTTLHRPYYGSDCALLAELALLGSFARVETAVLYSRDHPARSVNQHSSARITWQNPAASNTNAYELTSRLLHLFVIAFRHRRVAPLRCTTAYLFAWALHPLVGARIALEAVGGISPSLRRVLRGVGAQALGKAQRRCSLVRTRFESYLRGVLGGNTRAGGT